MRESSPSGSNQYLVLLALWLMVFSASAQIIIVSPILPEIGEELGVEVDLLGLLMSVYPIALAAMALITGPISDKFGRRRILLLGTSAMAVTLFLHGIATNFTSLVIVRGLAGGAGGMLSGAAVAYVGDYFSYDRRGWANGWVMSGVAGGQILGIPIGKIIAAQLGFRWPFIVFAITMTLAVVLVWFFVPQPDVARDEQRLSIRGSFSKYIELLKRRPVFFASVAYFLMFLSISLYIVFLPYWMENVVGITKNQIASLFLVGGFANVVAGPSAGYFSDRVGRKPLIIASCIGMGIIMLVTTSYVTGIIQAYVIFGGAMVMLALRMSPLQSLMTAIVSSERRGMVMSVAVAIGQVGFGIGAFAAGPIYNNYGYHRSALAASIAIALMAVVVYMFLPEPKDDGEAVAEDVAAAATDGVVAAVTTKST